MDQKWTKMGQNSNSLYMLVVILTLDGLTWNENGQNGTFGPEVG